MIKPTHGPTHNGRNRTIRTVAALGVAALALLIALSTRDEANVAPSHPSVSSVRQRASRPASWKPQVAPSISITGVVRDAAGTTLAGAVVCAVSVNAGLLGSPKERCADTSDQGTFALAGLAAGGYVVRASALGFAPAVADGGRPFVLIDGESRSGVEITLSEGGAKLTGVVVDATGGVVPRATVHAARLPGSLDTIHVTADDDGRFALSTSAGSVALSAQSDGYCRSRLVYATAPSAGLMLVLVPESTIAGTIVTPDGEPVPGMRVSAEALGGMGMPSELSAPSNAQGEFVVTGLSSGTYALSAEGDHRRGFEPGPFELDVADRVHGALIVVDPASAVAGRVVLADTGEPCPSGKVTLMPPEDAASPLPAVSALIDGNGNVALVSVVPGTYSVDVVCRNHVLRDGPQTVTVGPDDVSGLLWKVGLGLALEVRIIDELEHPVPHAPFMLQIPQPPGAPPAAMMGTTDAQGSYAYAPVLPPGRYVVKANGTLRGEPVVVELREGEGKVTATLLVEGSAYLTVTVRTTTGQAVNNIIVTARSADEVAPTTHGVGAGPALGMLQRPSAVGASIGDGQYKLGPLTPGRYEIAVDDSVNPPSTSGTSTSVLVRAGSESQAVVTVDRGGSIAGTVRGSDGEPLSDVWVSASPSLTQSDSQAGLVAAMNRARGVSPAHRVLTDARGHFRLESLESSASFDLRAETLKGGVALARGARTGDVVTLSFSASGTLRGAAVRDDGSPAVESSVQVTQIETGWSRVSPVKPDGSWELEGVGAGRIRVLAADDHGYVARNDIELRPNQTLDQIRLVLKPRAPAPDETSDPAPAL